MTLEELKNELKETLMQDDYMLINTVKELNGWDGSYPNLCFYENDEYFFLDFFGSEPMEAVRAAYYGNYKYMDEYVRFNGYGNLESMDKYEMIQQIQNEINGIVDSIIDYHYELNLDIEIIDLIDKYYDDEEN